MRPLAIVRLARVGCAARECMRLGSKLDRWVAFAYTYSKTKNKEWHEKRVQLFRKRYVDRRWHIVHRTNTFRDPRIECLYNSCATWISRNMTSVLFQLSLPSFFLSFLLPFSTFFLWCSWRRWRHNATSVVITRQLHEKLGIRRACLHCEPILGKVLQLFSLPTRSSSLHRFWTINEYIGPA